MMTRWINTLAAVVVFASISPAHGATPEQAIPNRCAMYVPEAARRSGLSEDVLARVMLAESGGNARIVSVKGAIGCMQIMPATWAYLTARYNLGADPYDARMNMIGGAMYLAELAARYGWPGALAAYNAGPVRYQRYVQGGVPLPSETIAYTTRIDRNAGGPPAVVSAPRWQEARLFMTRPTFEDATVLSTAPMPATANVGVQQSNLLFPFSRAPRDDNATGVRP